MEKQITEKFATQVLELARSKMSGNEGGPFAALVVKDGKVIAEGWNQVTSTNDPSAHAEVQAIRKACKILGDFQLTDCDLYTSCEPCPMCLGAIYWARPKAVYFVADRYDAAKIGFDDQMIYDEIVKPIESRSLPFFKLSHPQALAPFEAWSNKADKIEY